MSASQPIHFDDIPSGQKVVKVLGCMWGVSTIGQISISWFVGPFTDDEIAQLIKMTKNNPGTEDLKKADSKSTKDFPQAWCSTYTPPATAAKGGMPMSTCAGGAKGHGLSLTFMSPARRSRLIKRRLSSQGRIARPLRLHLVMNQRYTSSYPAEFGRERLVDRFQPPHEQSVFEPVSISWISFDCKNEAMS